MSTLIITCIAQVKMHLERGEESESHVKKSVRLGKEKNEQETKQNEVKGAFTQSEVVFDWTQEVGLHWETLPVQIQCKQCD